MIALVVVDPQSVARMTEIFERSSGVWSESAVMRMRVFSGKLGWTRVDSARPVRPICTDRGPARCVARVTILTDPARNVGCSRARTADLVAPAFAEPPAAEAIRRRSRHHAAPLAALVNDAPDSRNEDSPTGYS